MRETNENRTHTLISAIVSLVSMIMIIILLLVFGLKSQIPPPPPKKTFYVDIEQLAGGGGGGGEDAPTPQNAPAPSAPNYATQNAQHNVPSAPKAPTTSTQTTSAPKVNQQAMYKGGRKGPGTGGGDGNGNGLGTGNGLGPGTGSGSGGGIGYGHGSRGLVNNINTVVTEEGQVSVEVHILADGTVIDAKVVNTSEHKTTIANSQIQRLCVAKAKQARYKAGKEELRVIVFHN